jgi:hypothetical protein
MMLPHLVYDTILFSSKSYISKRRNQVKNNNIVTVNRVIYQAEIFPELKLDFGYLTN